ncbi:integrase/recombinase XerC [Bradyrhizobium sp. JR6.1]
MQPLELDCADVSVTQEMTRWLSHLRAERRLSPKTLEAYARDVRQCLAFLAGHWGARVTLAAFSALEASDVRAFMAMRRAEEIGGRSLMRALAGLRSFGRFLEREGKGKVGALSAIRAPKVAKSLPKPIHMEAAKRFADADERAGETRETWILVRDAAVMALLYGSGLRISEALGLKRRDVPKPGEGDVLVVTGKGNKTRMVPVLHNVLQLIADYAAICPHQLSPTGPMFVGARGGPLSPRIIQLTMERLRGALGLPRQRNAACAAALLRHPSAQPRRRPARDPGIARPRIAVDHADLHRHRQRAPAGSLSLRAPARLSART